MGKPSPVLLEQPAANHLASPRFVYERRQPELGALHQAVRTGWPQVKALGIQLALGEILRAGFAGMGLSGLRPSWKLTVPKIVLQR